MLYNKMFMKEVVMSLNESTPETTYLDDLTNVLGIYSTNKLISTTTNSIRVRRSSDNAEQDIGFSGQTIDEASLLSFCGAGNGFITTFYDQKNSNNFVQTDSDYQPQVVSSGTYLDGMLFDMSDDHLIKESGLGNAGSFMVYYTMNMVDYTVNSTTRYFIDIQTGRCAFGMSGTTGNIIYFDGSSNRNYGSGIDFSTYKDSMRAIAFLNNATDSTAKLYIDNSLVDTYSSYSSKDLNGDITIGSRYSGTSNYAKIKLNTMIVQAEASTDNLTSIYNLEKSLLSIP